MMTIKALDIFVGIVVGSIVQYVFTDWFNWKISGLQKSSQNRVEN